MLTTIRNIICNNFVFAKIIGVPVKTNVLTLLYLIGISATSTSFPFFTALALMMSLFFGIVLLHEFGHVLMAKHYGYNTHDVCITILGGVATIPNLENMSNQQMFFVAWAGPAVNIALAPIFYICGLKTLLMINIFMLLFNLIPFFPLDGGRIFKSILGSFIKDELTIMYILLGAAAICCIGFVYMAILLKNPMFILLGAILMFHNIVYFKYIKQSQKT